MIMNEFVRKFYLRDSDFILNGVLKFLMFVVEEKLMLLLKFFNPLEAFRSSAIEVKSFCPNFELALYWLLKQFLT